MQKIFGLTAQVLKARTIREHPHGSTSLLARTRADSLESFGVLAQPINEVASSVPAGRGASPTHLFLSIGQSCPDSRPGILPTNNVEHGRSQPALAH